MHLKWNTFTLIQVRVVKSCNHEDETGAFDEWRCPHCDNFNSVSRVSCIVCNYCIALECVTAHSGKYSSQSRSLIPPVREEIPSSEPSRLDTYIPFASFEPVSTANVSTNYIQYAKEVDIRAAERITSNSDIKSRTTSECSRDCPRNCPNNRVYIHNFPHTIRRQDLEEWLERVGSLEAVTKSGKQHRHLVIWDNGNGTCDAVA